MIHLTAFDTETTGVDPETARIVSAALVMLDPDGGVLHHREWLINPGIPIPEEATAVHGITTEHARTHGIPPEQGIHQIITTLHEWHTAPDGEGPLGEPTPLVVFNAPYDLTVLDREAHRIYGHGMLEHMDEGTGTLVRENWIGPVFDPLVIDKHVDKYRKGSRTLEAMAAFHGVEFEGPAHGATADALTAGRLMQRLPAPAERGQYAMPVLMMMASADLLHHAQIQWRQQQADSFADYLRHQGRADEAASIDGTWPIRERTPE